MSDVSDESPPYHEDDWPTTNTFGEQRVRQLVTETIRNERTLNELQLGVDAHSVLAFTDPQGVILEVSDMYLELSGYSREELVGAPASIVNSGRHPPSFFAEMWQAIARGRIWQGTICNRAKDGTECWVAATIVPLLDAEGRIERYLSIYTHVSQLQSAETRLRKLAYSDQLTDLPNRAAMLMHLSDRVGRDARSTGLYVTAEFDDLAMIKDMFGFAAGDRFLCRAAEQLGTLTRRDSPLDQQADLVARVDPSAFGIAFSGLPGDLEETGRRCEELARGVCALFEEAVKAEFGRGIEPGVRVGYVAYPPGGELDGADVFTRAEIARRHLATVPSRSRAGIAVFEQRMVDEARARADLVSDLREGVAENKLRLYLQPIVDAEREVVGYEALLRWIDPERGILPPSQFMHLAEETGLIVEIGEWALDEACRILAIWAKYPATSGYTISVNVSVRQLRSKTFVGSVRAALQRHGVAPERLRLEVTESELHTDLEQSVEILQELSAERVQIALDDFGTGYASLNHLNRLPVQQLKIDRSFITEITGSITNMAIVAAIVHLARLMRLSVVAEGVETEEQFDALLSLGVDAFQGYLFGKPEPLGV